MAFDPADPTDPHHGIPLAEDGNPIFFILPPGVQASYDRRMLNCKQGWKATGDPGFVREARIWAFFHRQPDPLWLTEAVIALAERRGGKGHAKRALAAARDLMRYEAVCAAPQPGSCCDLATERLWTWKDCFEFAAKGLAGTCGAGKWPTVKTSYQRVKRDLKGGRGGLYLRPLPTSGRKFSDAIKRQAERERARIDAVSKK
jgi:hypothetical protein